MLRPGQWQTVLVDYRLAPGSSPGAVSVGVLEAVDHEDPALAGEGSFTVTTAGAGTLVPPPTVEDLEDLGAAPGETLDPDPVFPVTNNAGIARTYRFTAVSSDHAVAADPADPEERSIAAGETVEVPVTVVVREDAVAGETTRIELTATDTDAADVAGTGRFVLEVVDEVGICPIPGALNFNEPGDCEFAYERVCTVTLSDTHLSESGVNPGWHTNYRALAVSEDPDSLGVGFDTYQDPEHDDADEAGPNPTSSEIAFDITSIEVRDEAGYEPSGAYATWCEEDTQPEGMVGLEGTAGVETVQTAYRCFNTPHNHESLHLVYDPVPALNENETWGFTQRFQFNPDVDRTECFEDPMFGPVCMASMPPRIDATVACEGREW